ncbi:MAG TPA: hypothetical protein VLY04_17485 [Bryobacteraceae bacterium]|nr:hypothetical protein [Bryobacteraceae bacterium]
MTPSEPLPEGTPPPAVTGPAAAPEPEYRWYHKTGAVLFITFCLEIGLFLLIFPWTDYWENFANFVGGLRRFCDNLYVRGAISGVGVINLYISLVEVFGLRRFAGRRVRS